MTLLDALLRVAENAPEKTAFSVVSSASELERAITYGELDRAARAIADWLQAHNGAGERVLLDFPAGLDFITAFWGCAYAGAIAVPVPHGRSLPQEFTARLLRDANPRFICGNSSASKGRAWQNVTNEAQYVDTSSLDMSRANSWRQPVQHGSDIAYLQYTSGSTSAPKGVIITHDNLIANIRYIDSGFRHTKESVVVTWLPHYHDMGLVYGIVLPIFYGIPCVCMSPMAFMQTPALWLSVISKTRATHSGGPNFAYDACVRKVSIEERDRLDLSSWRVAFNGAEPVSQQTMEVFYKTFRETGFSYNAFHAAYGLAEATLKVSAPKPDAAPTSVTIRSGVIECGSVELCPTSTPQSRSVVSCGVTNEDTTVIIVNPTSRRECVPGGIGELWVNGPGVSPGYWRREEDTAETFNGVVHGRAERFLRTGDLGFILGGQLYPLGRIKDLLIIRGANYYPEDIEAVVSQSIELRHLGRAAAFGIEWNGGEKVVVIAEAGTAKHNSFSKGKDFNEVLQNIRNAISTSLQLEVYAVGIVKRGMLPRTTSGKLQRSRCRDLFLGNQFDFVAISTLHDPGELSQWPKTPDKSIDNGLGNRIETYLVAALKTLLGHKASIERESNMVGLGLDSLMATELQRRLEQDFCGIPIRAVDFLKDGTVAGCARLIEQALCDGSPSKVKVAVDRQSAWELSPEQRRLLLLQDFAPISPAYNLCATVQIDGAIHIHTLRAALQTVVLRHKPLHSLFSGSSPRAHTLNPKALPHISLCDMSMIEPPQPGESAAEITRTLAERPFSFETPLVRLVIIKFSANLHAIAVVMHHLIADAHSLEVFSEELSTCYKTITNDGSALISNTALSYSDCSRLSNEAASAAAASGHLAWWKKYLGPNLPVMQFPRRRTTRDTLWGRSKSRKAAIPADLMTGLMKVRSSANVTPFTIFLAAYAAILHWCCGQEDLLIACPVSGRWISGSESLIGLFAYPLPIRLTVKPERSVRDLLAHVKENVLAVMEHSQVPLLSILGQIKTSKQHKNDPTLPILFSFVSQRQNGPTDQGPIVRGRVLQSPFTDIDLTLALNDIAGAYEVCFTWNADILDDEMADWCASSYLDVLKAIATGQEYTLLEALDLPRVPLLAQETSARRDENLTIQISSTFTADPVRDTLEYWLHRLDLSAALRFGQAGQVFQDLLIPNGATATNTGINLILLRLADFSPDLSCTGPISELHRDLTQKVREFASTAMLSSSRLGAHHLIICCASADDPDPELQDVFVEVEDELQDLCKKRADITIVTSAKLHELYPTSERADPYSDRVGLLPYTPTYFAAIATMAARQIFNLVVAPKKVIAFDCDHTLWDGVCGEVGPTRVHVDGPAQIMQETLRTKARAGFLLCLSSHNRDEDVLRVFDENSAMRLRRTDITAYRIDWLSKVEQLVSLAQGLKVRLESFVFIDDDPVQCAEVRSALPEVLTLLLPADRAQVGIFLRHIWPLDVRATTEEDSCRADMYRETAERERAASAADTFEAFLATLELEVKVSPLTPEHLERASQLTFRTTQFNLTGRRWSAAELARALESKTHGCWTVEARDRFGSYGVVGFIAGALHDGTFLIETFVLSCRALGKQIEQKILIRLGKYLAEGGIKKLRLQLRRTTRNTPAAIFFEGLSSKNSIVPRDGVEELTILVDELSTILQRSTSKQQPKVGGEGYSRGISGSYDMSLRQEALVEIAESLHDSAAILSAVRSRRHCSQVSTPGGYVSPRSRSEEIIVSIWSELLNTSEISVHDDFFTLGGQSILAVQVLSRIHQEIGVEIPMSSFFSGELTVASLAALVDAEQVLSAESSGR